MTTPTVAKRHTMTGFGLHGSAEGADSRTVASRERRGQTTLDFAVGMSIFLVALVFVLAFVPGMLEPFSGGTQSETPAVNRVADDLTQRTLTDGDQAYVLDETCTVALFTSGSPSACRYDGDSLSDKVGILERSPVNVTIRGDLDSSGSDSFLCWDGTADTVRERGHPDCDTVLSAGSKPAGSGGKTVSAHRVALLDGEDVTIEVVMW